MGRQRQAVLAGAAAQLAGVLWILQWAHVLVAHGPTSYDGRGTWLGMTWMDSAKFLALAYLLLIPAVRYVSSRPVIADLRGTAFLRRLTVGALVVAAAATAVEFRLWEWRTYTGTFDGAGSALWIAGPIRSIASAIVLTVGFAGLGVRAARTRVVPLWLPPLLVVAALSTVFIGGPLPPFAGLVWLVLGGWLLADASTSAASATATPHTSREAVRQA